MRSFRKLSANALLFSLLCIDSNSFSLNGHQNTRRRNSATTPQLADKNRNGPSSDAKPKGVYVRPSAVIEKGSGFFFPGLEGPRVRLVVGSGLLLGAIETSKEGRIESISVRGGSGKAADSKLTADVSQRWSAVEGATSSFIRDRIEWAAASYLSLTPATHMILIKDGTIHYWLGVTPNKNLPSAAQACAAALATLQQSKGGRVALPEDHPAVKGVLEDQAYSRCVILQRIDQSMCWMVTSNDLLASFTKQDLQWLGRFAKYVARTNGSNDG